MNCPLCLTTTASQLEPSRPTYQCSHCHLVFIDPDQHLELEAEKARYLMHENTLDNPGYREFLEQLWIPLRHHLKPAVNGLDFGCGPTEAFRELAAESGFQVESYDPFFKPHKELLVNKYNFIFCSEVVEHFYQPHKEFTLLSGLLKPGGVLAVMTERLEDWSQFAQWHYQREPSHVCFYPEQTMHWIARYWGWELIYQKGRVSLLRNSRLIKPIRNMGL